jgi:pimeloyl-ACP methyl ester carboxylesterase
MRGISSDKRPNHSRVCPVRPTITVTSRFAAGQRSMGQDARRHQVTGSTIGPSCAGSCGTARRPSPGRRPTSVPPKELALGVPPRHVPARHDRRGVQLDASAAPRRPAASRLEAIRRTPRCPVVLVHGYVHNRSAFLWMTRGLRRAGFRTCTASTTTRCARTSPSIAQQLAVEVDRVLAATGAKRCMIVGHSMGGIVARYYVQASAGTRRSTPSSPWARPIAARTPRTSARAGRAGPPAADAAHAQPRGDRPTHRGALDRLLLGPRPARRPRGEREARPPGAAGDEHPAARHRAPVAAAVRRGDALGRRPPRRPELGWTGPSPGRCPRICRMPRASTAPPAAAGGCARSGRPATRAPEAPGGARAAIRAAIREEAAPCGRRLVRSAPAKATPRLATFGWSPA